MQIKKTPSPGRRQRYIYEQGGVKPVFTFFFQGIEGTGTTEVDDIERIQKKDMIRSGISSWKVGP